MIILSKLKYEDVKKEVEKEGWQLLSTDYANLKTDMSFKCTEGHVNYYSLEKWRRGHICITCKENPYINIKTNPIKKNGYRILAFDQASITSGWAVFDNEKLISYGKWTSEGTHSTERIGQTKYWVASMTSKWKPDLLVFEDIQLQKFGDGNEAVLTYKKLAHLQGVLKNFAFENGIPYKIVPPATWRSFSEIKGKTRVDKKKSAQLKIKRTYDVSVTQDEADAILIGAWAAYDHNQSKIIMFE